MKTKPTRPTLTNQQADTFVSALHEMGWKTLRTFLDDGHIFELLCFGTKMLLIQIYPDSDGFEVWRPVTPSPWIADTHKGVEEWRTSK